MNKHDEEIVRLLEERMDWHKDKDSCDYNECEKDPCQWCYEAKVVVDRIKMKEPIKDKTKLFWNMCK